LTSYYVQINHNNANDRNPCLTAVREPASKV
jgi:hypothetical protein